MTDQNMNLETPDNLETLFDSEDKTVAPDSQQEDLTISQEQLKKIMKQNSHAQEYINRLKEENQRFKTEVTQLQRDLQNSKSLDDLLDSLESQDHSNLSGRQAPQLDRESLLSELKEEVFRDLTRKETEALERQNFQESVRVVKQAFGDDFQKKLEEIGQDVGLSKSQLDQLAKTSPKAFAQLVGAKPQGSKGTPPSTSSLRTTPSFDSGEFDFAKVAHQKGDHSADALDAKRTWNSPEFQAKMRQQILERASKEGSKFGNTI